MHRELDENGAFIFLSKEKKKMKASGHFSKTKLC